MCELLFTHKPEAQAHSGSRDRPEAAEGCTDTAGTETGGQAASACAASSSLSHSQRRPQPALPQNPPPLSAFR